MLLMLLCTLMTWEVWRALKRGFEKREWSFWLFKCRISSDFIGKMFCFFIVSIVKEKFCKPDSSYISLNCIFRPLNSQAFKLRFVLSVKGLEKACKWIYCCVLLCFRVLASRMVSLNARVAHWFPSQPFTQYTEQTEPRTS